ncbi:MAG: GYF domain-containing protein [Myxococcota bacterium]
MRFACDQCGAKYQVADHKVGPRGAKVRCKKCGHVNILRPKPPEEDVSDASVDIEQTSISVELPSFEPEGPVHVEAEVSNGALPHDTPGSESSPADDTAFDATHVDLRPETAQLVNETESGSNGEELKRLGDSLAAELADDLAGTLDSMGSGPSWSASSSAPTKSVSGAKASPVSPLPPLDDGDTGPGIEKEIGSAFAAMFGPETLAADAEPIPPHAASSSTTMPLPSSDVADESRPDGAVWFFAIRDQQVGPVTLEELEQRWVKGEIGPNHLCWKDGMSDWTPIRYVSDLSKLPGFESRLEEAAEATSEDVSYEVLPSLAHMNRGGPAPDDAVPVPGWKPSAASALDSLAAEEMAGPAPEPVATASPLASFPAAEGPQGPPPPPASGPSISGPAPAAAEAPSAAGPALRAHGRPPRRVPVWALAVAVVVAVLGVGGAGWALLMRPSSPATPVAQAPAPKSSSADPGPTQPEPSTSAPDEETTDEGGPSGSASEDQAVQPTDEAERVPTSASEPDSPRAAPEPVAKTEATKAAPKPSAKPESRRTEPAANPTPKPPPRKQRTSPARTPPPPAPSRASRATTDVDDLLGSATTQEERLPSQPDQGDVLAVLRNNGQDVRRCLERHNQSDSELRGTMRVNISVVGTGRVRNVSITPAQFRDAEVGRCVDGAIRQWRFPKFSGAAYPIDFPVPVGR